jgi:hypothetical protein
MNVVESIKIAKHYTNFNISRKNAIIAVETKLLLKTQTKIESFIKYATLPDPFEPIE